MAYIHCTKCDARISDKAKVCTKCGEPQLGKNTKFCIECGTEIGSDKPTLSKIENGLMIPSVYFMARICKGLEISETEFFKDFG